MDERDESWLPLPEDEGGCVVPPHDGYPVGVLHLNLLPILLPRRFLVVMDILKPEHLESSSVLQGLEYLDVPGSATKDYKLTFLSYKEGVFNTMVSVGSSLRGPSRSCGLPGKLLSCLHTSPGGIGGVLPAGTSPHAPLTCQALRWSRWGLRSTSGSGHG